MPIVASVAGNTANQTTALLLNRLGRNPAMGSSVILAGVTDAPDFLIFLSLATVLLV